MKRIRFGIKLRLPFGLFKNAGIFVIRASEKQAIDLEQRFFEFYGLLSLVDRNAAEDLVFEVE